MVQVKTMEKENTNSLQVGAGPVKLKNVNKPLFGHYEKVHVEPKRFLTEFKVSEDAFLPVGRWRFESGRAQVSTTQACGIEVYSANRMGYRVEFTFTSSRFDSYSPLVAITQPHTHLF